MFSFIGRSTLRRQRARATTQVSRTLSGQRTKGERRWRCLGDLARVVVSLFVSAWFVGTALAEAPPAVEEPAAPPTVTQHPDIVILLGALESGSFTAMASGSPAPTVQWQVASDRNGPWADIPGATSTTLSFSASPDSVFLFGHAFRAVFANHAGTAMSRPAKLVWKQQWMHDLGSDIAFVPLTELTIPGTHDMGTYGITGSSEDSADDQAFGCGIAHSVCEAYGRAQDRNRNAERQLNEGIRYFDLRVCVSFGDFVTCHGLEAAPLQEILDQTRTWIDSHPYEIVFLDFNHHYRVDPDAEAQRIEDAFALPDDGSLLIPPQYCTPGDPNSGICANNLTLQGIAQQNLGRVIVNFVQDGVTEDDAAIRPALGADFYNRHLLFWGRSSSLPSAFGDNPDTNTVLARVLDSLRNRGNFDTRHFFVQFLQTTPRPTYIANHLGGGLRDMALTDNPIIGPAVLGCDAVNPCFGQFRPENLNILAINYYNLTDYKVRRILIEQEAEDCEAGLSSCPLTPEQQETLVCVTHPETGVRVCEYDDPVRFDFVGEVIRFNAYARTPPVVYVQTSLTPTAAGWYNAAVLGGEGRLLPVDVVATDYRYPTGVPELNCRDHNGLPLLNVRNHTSSVTTSGHLALPDGTHLIICRAEDGAALGFHQEGNRGAGPGSTPAPVMYRVDTTPPTVNCSSTELILNQPAATVGATVTDETSGPQTSTVSAVVSTSSVGSFSATLTALDVAGNSTTVSCPYTVSYGTALRYDPTAPRNSGSTVPIRVQLVDYFGNDVSDKTIPLTAVSVTNTGVGTVFAPTAPGNANADRLFYLSPAKGYVYNLKTTGYASGSYTLDFVVGEDPLTHHATFLIR